MDSGLGEPLFMASDGFKKRNPVEIHLGCTRSFFHVGITFSVNMFPLLGFQVAVARNPFFRKQRPSLVCDCVAFRIVEARIGACLPGSEFIWFFFKRLAESTYGGSFGHVGPGKCWWAWGPNYPRKWSL